MNGDGRTGGVAGRQAERDETGATTPTAWGLPLFFGLAFGLSWSALGALQAIATSAGVGDWQALGSRAETTFDLVALAPALAVPLWSVRALNLIADFGPSVAALIVAIATGRLGVLLRRLGRWRVGARWYVVAFGLPAAVMASAITLFALLGGEIGPIALGAGTLPALLGWLLLRTLAGGGLGEELGWRGFALPRLQARMGAVAATGVLGSVWALWHLPLVLVSSDPLLQGAVLLLFIAPMAFVYTWLFNGTGGSVLLPVLLHGAQNGIAVFLERSLLPGLAAADGWVALRVLLLLGVAAFAAVALARQGRRGAVIREPEVVAAA